MPLTGLRRGDEVAILPMPGAPSEKVIAIAKVIYSGATLIELDNGSMYLVASGQGMNVANCIVAVTEEHRMVISRHMQSA
jgi:hypothetical protein